MRRRRAAGPPDFVGVGTLAAGTGWWHDMLVRHPEIDAPYRRDRAVHFFDEFCAREMTDADVASYHEAFRPPPGRIAGEWTPRYMFDPWVAPLLARAAPDAKLLVLVGDPIERYRLRLARELQAAASPDEIAYLFDMAPRGRYASQLRALRAFFAPERILVLQHERCIADPQGEYARTLRFLGVRDDFWPRPSPVVRAALALGVPPDLKANVVRVLRRRALEPPPAPLWPDIEQALRAELDPEVLELAAAVPELDLALWPNFARLAG